VKRAFLAAGALVACACNRAPVCNGHVELCARAYDAVAYAGTHDAYADLADGYVNVDQTNTMRQQLDDGIRVLHLEIVSNGGGPFLCHSICELGARPLEDGLAEIEAFVAAHDGELVTLLTESSGATTDQIAAAFDQAGLTAFTRAHALGEPWPTLGAMLARGERAVVFHADNTQTGGSTFDWMLDRFAWTWETPWDNETLADFARCDADRGTKGNSIYVVDNYLEDLPIETAANAEITNNDPFLVDRLLDCEQIERTLPNFVMVDFYEVGDVLGDVEVLNGFVPTPAFDAGAD